MHIKNIVLIVGAVVLAAILVGLFVSGQLFSLPWMLLAALRGQGQGPQPTLAWSTPTPTLAATATPSPTVIATALPTFTPTPTHTPRPTVFTVMYTVQPGDTLESIAAMFGVEPATILKASNLPPDSAIFPGLVLFIPAPSRTPTPMPTWTPTVTGTITTTVGP